MKVDSFRQLAYIKLNYDVGQVASPAAALESTNNMMLRVDRKEGLIAIVRLKDV